MKLKKFKTNGKYKKYEFGVKSNTNKERLAEEIYSNLRETADINLYCYSLKAVNQVMEALYIVRSISLLEEDMFDITISPYPDEAKANAINLILNKVII